MSIAIYTLISQLHDEKAVEMVTDDFLGSLGIEYELKGNDYADYGNCSLNLIYVRTGGTEGVFRRLLPELQRQSRRPFYLLTSGKSNSLAASMEILSYLRQHNIKGEILHDSSVYITQRIHLLEKTEKALKQMEGQRLGIIGEPSDWLISSHADKGQVKKILGLELVDIPMKELLDILSNTPESVPAETSNVRIISEALPGANRIYMALKTLVDKYQLQGLTLRCFDLLTTVKNTGCMALAKLNAEGIVAGCEGDVPAMLSMKITQALTGVSGFQSNPSTINPETGEMLFAHCTIPLDMVDRYELDTHFESGIGVAIRGYMRPGPVTIFKVAGDLSRCFIAEGELTENQAKPDLCRTQQVIQLKDKTQVNYFLTNPIGNHHIVIPGHQQALLEKIMEL